MLGFHKTVPIVVTGVMLRIPVGCEGNDSDTQPAVNGTVVDTTHASALVQGGIEGTVSGDVRIRINNVDRAINLTADNSFVVRNLPSGSVVFSCDVGPVTGRVIINDVRPGEVIDISIRQWESTLTIAVVARLPPSEPPRQVLQTEGAPLAIRANNVCLFLPTGITRRDVTILGSHVALVGTGTCVGPDHSTLQGSLTIAGDDVLVFDVELQGAVAITGSRTRIENTCGATCFSEACFRGGCSGNCGPACVNGACTTKLG